MSEEVIKQYPFDLKGEATAKGYRIHGHVYSDNMEEAVVNLADMLKKTEVEFERRGLILAPMTNGKED